MSAAIRVSDVNGLTVVVSITKLDASSVAVFSDAGCLSSVSMPATITEDTDFFVKNAGEYLCSALIGSLEFGPGSVPIAVASGSVSLVPVATDRAATERIIAAAAIVDAAAKGMPVGLTGAVLPTRYVGRWAATGAPAAGTFAVGDFGFDGANNVQVCTVAGSQGTWVAAGSGTSSPVRVHGGLNSTWVAKGFAPVDLVANVAGDDMNTITGSLGLAVYPANTHLGRLVITVPVLPAGVLTLRNAEIYAASPDGANALSMGLSAPLVLTDGIDQVITLDSPDFEFNAIGADLTYDGTGHFHTTAGGVYSIGWSLELIWEPA